MKMDAAMSSGNPGERRPFYEIVRPISFTETPRARSDLIGRSIVTVGSPASILATRDWLDLTTLANSA
jgi:hypothetical protein